MSWSKLISGLRTPGKIEPDEAAMFLAELEQRPITPAIKEDRTKYLTATYGWDEDAIRTRIDAMIEHRAGLIALLKKAIELNEALVVS
jgi:hypothetical protein